MQRILGRLSRLSPAAVVGCCLIVMVSAFAIPLLPAWAAAGPFADFAGNWSGSGTLRAGGAAAERIRCTANYRQLGSSHHEVDLRLSCTSDSYSFDLSGQFTADERNNVTGFWTDHSRNIGGTAAGRAQGNRLVIHTESSAFSANLVLVTHNRRQSVTIDSQGGGQTVKASISLGRN